MNFQDVKKAIFQKKEQKKILIAAHRGTCGGYIVQNTIPAYENALKHGADILEVDVIMSHDGHFYTFHNGMEKVVLGTEHDIRTMSAAEIEALTCYNGDGNRISQKVEKLDHVLEQFKGRCLINIDRSWFYWEQSVQALLRHNMPDQLILKSHVDPKLLNFLQNEKVELMYMPIVSTVDQLETVLNFQLHLIAVEIIFKDLNSPLIQPKTIQALKSKDILTWVNPITLDDDHVFSGYLDDLRAITVSEEENWGRLIEMGFDILQTDWPLLLRKFVDGQLYN